MELRILTWLFPWLMAVLEFLLRSALHDAGTVSFIGSTVGAAALGMLLPLIRPRELPNNDSLARKTISFDRREDHLAQLANLALWLGLIAWAVSLYLSLTGGGEVFINLDSERTSILIGAILWLIAVMFDIVRGVKK